jgi:hypothetical protein
MLLEVSVYISEQLKFAAHKGGDMYFGGGDMYFGGGYAHGKGGLTRFWPQARLRCQIVVFLGN